MATCTVCEREEGLRDLFTWRQCSRYGCGRQYCKGCFRGLPRDHTFNVPLCEGGHGFSVALCAVCEREDVLRFNGPRYQGRVRCLACDRVYCGECFNHLPQHNPDEHDAASRVVRALRYSLHSGKECVGGHKFKHPAPD